MQKKNIYVQIPGKSLSKKVSKLEICCNLKYFVARQLV